MSESAGPRGSARGLLVAAPPRELRIRWCLAPVVTHPPPKEKPHFRSNNLLHLPHARARRLNYQKEKKKILKAARTAQIQAWDSSEKSTCTPR